MAHPISIEARTKREAAIEFRRKVVIEYERWYRGELGTLFGQPTPAPHLRETRGNHRENAILTWAKLHQEPKYRRVLRLDASELRGMKVLDLGSGGIPSCLAFAASSVVCVDPLVRTFQELDYPFSLYDPRARFVGAKAEALPFRDGRFDAVVSVNAIDHFDDLVRTAAEIERVLKPGGMLRFHVHSHTPSVLEPLALDDATITGAFRWSRGLRKLAEWSEPDDQAGERHALWAA